MNSSFNELKQPCGKVRPSHPSPGIFKAAAFAGRPIRPVEVVTTVPVYNLRSTVCAPASLGLPNKLVNFVAPAEDLRNTDYNQNQDPSLDSSSTTVQEAMEQTTNEKPKLPKFYIENKFIDNKPKQSISTLDAILSKFEEMKFRIPYCADSAVDLVPYRNSVVHAAFYYKRGVKGTKKFFLNSFKTYSKSL